MTTPTHERTFSIASTIVPPDSSPRLPTTQLLILSICRFAEPVALTGIFPYLPAMIESFDIPHADVAYWAGVTSAVFSLFQCMTAIQWGRASDKYGRKPVILCAMSCAMSSSLLFGFSTSLRWAIVARAASGMANGNVGILRTTVAELVPQKKLQPKAFSIMPLVWQVGAVVGPMIGGSLADPVTNLPAVFGQSRLFKMFPFLLPNLANAVIFTVGLTTGILFLKESLEAKKGRRDYGRVVGDKILACVRGRRRKELRPADDFESATAPRKQPIDLAPPAYREVFNSQSSLALLAYTLLAMHNVAYDQLLSVFMYMPREERPSGTTTWIKFSGGFGLDSSRIGLIFSIFGIFAMVTQFAVFPWVTSRLGALYCMRVCTFVLPLTYFLTPYMVLMPTTTLQQVAIMGVMFVKALAGVFAFPCITILLTNSASSLRLLGTLNGVATSTSAIGRALGPFLAGRTYTWGVENGYVTPAWWLLTAFAIPGHIVTWWLIESEGFAGEADKAYKQEAEAYRDSVQLETLSSTAPVATGTDAVLAGKLDVAEEDFVLDFEDEDDGDTVEHRPLLPI